MIEVGTGDILKAPAEALINTVNCVGVMGRGIALQFKKKFPTNFEAYQKACQREEVQTGKMFVHHLGIFQPQWIINFPTKQHWKGKSKIEYIESGLVDLIKVVQEHNIKSIAIPPLGCGLGGLSWDTVRPMIVEAFKSLPEVKVLLFEPSGAPPVQEIVKGTVPKLTPKRKSLFALAYQYLAMGIAPFLTLLEIHKLTYFLQASGYDLKLKFCKAPYGPYADNLRHVLTDLEGHYIEGYGDGGDQPDKPIRFHWGLLPPLEQLIEETEDVRPNLERVLRLIRGFESPSSLELLATTHWVITQEGANTLNEVVQKVYAWNTRKRQFAKQDIEIAIKRLKSEGWVS